MTVSDYAKYKTLDLMELDDSAPEVAQELAKRFRYGNGVAANAKIAQNFSNYAAQTQGGMQAIDEQTETEELARIQNLSDKRLEEEAYESDTALWVFFERVLQKPDRFRSESFEKLLEHATKGYHGGKVAFRVARCFEMGVNIKPDEEKALYWYENAADCPDGEESFDKLAQAYQTGKLTKTGKPDYARAAEYRLRSASEADASAEKLAEFACGLCAKKPGFEKLYSADSAEEWMRRAVSRLCRESGVPDAADKDWDEILSVLAVVYPDRPEPAYALAQQMCGTFGCSALQNVPTARMFVNEGHREYAAALANMLEDEDAEANRDELQALRAQAETDDLIRRSKANDLTPEEMYRLGRQFLYGEGVEQDARKAMTELIIPAAECGHEESLRFLYSDELRHFIGLSPDIKITESAKLAAAEIGIPQACLWYAEDLQRMGSCEEALESYKRAANAYPGKCYLEMGNIYSDDTGSCYDVEEAFRCFQRARQAGSRQAADKLTSGALSGIFGMLERAESGDAYALLSLGRAYLNGEGVKRDVEKAKKIYAVAAEQDPEAAAEAAKLYLDEMCFGRDLAKCREYIDKAKRLDSSVAEIVMKLPVYIAEAMIEEGNASKIARSARAYYESSNDAEKEAAFRLGDWLSRNGRADKRERKNQRGLGCKICGELLEKGKVVTENTLKTAWQYYCRGADFSDKTCESRKYAMLHIGECFDREDNGTATADDYDILAREYEKGGRGEKYPELAGVYREKARKCRWF